MRRRIVLAYDGDIRTSIAIPWLSKRHRAEVVTVTLDLGERGDLEQIRQRALASGALRAHVLDLRDEFVRDYMLPALRAGVLCRANDPLTVPLARPLVAKTLIDIARIESADAVAHASTAGEPGGSTFATLVNDIDPDLRVLAPVPSLGNSRRMNLWGRSLSTMSLSYGATDPNEILYTLTRAEDATPDAPALMTIGFEQGIPVSISGVPMPLTELVESLTLIAGQHGVGRFERRTLRDDGTIYLEICEAPAAYVLHAVHADIGASVWSRDLVAIREGLSSAYANVIRDGRWFTSLRETLDAFHERANSPVTGVVHVQLLKGQTTIGASDMVSCA